MQARILPMPQNSTAKWSNWMSYLDRVESEIKSLQSYLDYFNPDNTLVNITPVQESDNTFSYTLDTLKFEKIFIKEIEGLLNEDWYFNSFS